MIIGNPSLGFPHYVQAQQTSVQKSGLVLFFDAQGL